ncbi:MAG: glycoside hydrolase family protein [Tabrizicola sp.]|jgi:lysozyme|nr:glycoside hydrolase family protein [Tabrizicola sp.]
MRMSAKGLAFLEAHEGVVLKAYRDPVGIWTIGAGLTSASGVVKVRPGMVLTKEEASNLLGTALTRNYEPGVVRAMVQIQGSTVISPKQHEFDAAVSFHFNTGAIARATWLKRWKAKAKPDLIRAGLMAWNKAGGRVLPGLTRRRREEADMLLDGRYAGIKPVEPRLGLARWALVLSPEEIARVRDGFRKLGYNPGPDTDGVVTASVVKFQADHDLKVDNIIGRATLSTLDRALAARSKGKVMATAAAASGGATALPEAAVQDVPGLGEMPWVTWVLLGLAILYALKLAWSYRDQVAAAVQSRLPRLAALLRSF